MKTNRFLIFALLMLPVTANAQTPAAAEAMLDIRNLNLDESRLALNGTWLYYPNSFASKHDPYTGKRISMTEAMWSEGQGYASYSMVLIVNSGQTLAISMPQVYSCYSLKANGKEIAANGKIGKSKAETVPQWLPQTVSFEATSDTLELILSIANFHHQKGGIKDPIYVGSVDSLNRYDRISMISNIVEVIILMVIALGFFILYYARMKKQMILFFSFLCLTWAIRAVFSNQYLFIQFFPTFSWDVMIRIEYLTLYLTLTWGILLLSLLFAKETNQILKYLLVMANILFIGFTLLASPIIFTQGLTLFLIIACITLIYAVVIVFKALVNEKAGAWSLTVSILLAIGIFAYDIVSFEGVITYNPIVLSTGYVLIFLFMGFTLLFALNVLKSKSSTASILRYDDFFGKK